MIIRKIDMKDMEKVSKTLFASGIAKSMEDARAVFKREFKKGDTYLLAEEDGKSLGLVTWIFHGSLRHGLAELYHIGVLPDQKGKNVAAQLYWAMLDDINAFFESQNHKLRKLYILTHADNARARGFYEKMGLKHETTLKDHFHKGTDECVYSYFPK